MPEKSDSPRPSTFHVWQDARLDQGERLAAFETWTANELYTRLQWPADPAKATRQVLQCRALILQAVADMGRHGFLFQPKTVAKLVTDTLDDVAQRQARGEIQDLYPYLRATWQGYVARQSDQLRAKAMALGSHISQITAKLDAIPRLVAEDRSETIHTRKLAAKRRAAPVQTKSPPPADPQLDLFPSP